MTRCPTGTGRERRGLVQIYYKLFLLNNISENSLFSCEISRMRSLVLLLLEVHLAYAARHSLQYLYTAVSEDIDVYEFTVVGLLDDQEFMHFDSNTLKTVPKTEWIRQNEGEDYWKRQTQISVNANLVFKNNIQIAKERFNQTAGVHTLQRMYGCEWDDETGEIDGFDQYGYDGEDFVSLDLKQLRYISPMQQGVITTQNWNDNRALLEDKKQYLNTLCIEWLKKYLQYGKTNLQKIVTPQVSLLQKESFSSVICHATGFYPKGITINWKKNEQIHDEDVDLGELVPNEEGTFQKTSTLKVTPDEVKQNQYSCVVEHQSKTIRIILTEDEIRTNSVNSAAIGIGGVFSAILLVFIGVLGYLIYQKKQGFKPVSASDGSNNSAQKYPNA